MFNLDRILQFMRGQGPSSKIAMVIVGGVIVAISVIVATGAWGDFVGFIRGSICNCESISEPLVSVEGDHNRTQTQSGTNNTMLGDVSIGTLPDTPTPKPKSTTVPTTTPSPYPSPTITPKPSPTPTVTPSPTVEFLFLPEEVIRKIFEPLVEQIESGNIVAQISDVELKESHERVEPVSSDVSLMNFAVDTTFLVPGSACWDFGLRFRDVGVDDHTRLVFECGGYWSLINENGGESKVVSSGQTDLIIDQEGEPNNIRLLVQGDKGYLVINDQLLTDLDLSERIGYGDIKIVSGEVERNRVTSEATIIDNFTVWAFEDSDIELTISAPGKLAFVVMSNENGDDIYIMNDNGTARTPLIVGNEDARYPVWSPDGHNIAYVSNELPRRKRTGYQPPNWFSRPEGRGIGPSKE